jgi:hypothetical protein
MGSSSYFQKSEYRISLNNSIKSNKEITQKTTQIAIEPPAISDGSVHQING